MLCWLHLSTAPLPLLSLIFKQGTCLLTMSHKKCFDISSPLSQEKNTIIVIGKELQKQLKLTNNFSVYVFKIYIYATACLIVFPV